MPSLLSFCDAVRAEVDGFCKFPRTRIDGYEIELLLAAAPAAERLAAQRKRCSELRAALSDAPSGPSRDASSRAFAAELHSLDALSETHSASSANDALSDAQSDFASVSTLLGQAASRVCKPAAPGSNETVNLGVVRAAAPRAAKRHRSLPESREEFRHTNLLRVGAGSEYGDGRGDKRRGEPDSRLVSGSTALASQRTEHASSHKLAVQCPLRNSPRAGSL